MHGETGLHQASRSSMSKRSILKWNPTSQDLQSNAPTVGAARTQLVVPVITESQARCAPNLQDTARSPPHHPPPGQTLPRPSALLNHASRSSNINMPERHLNHLQSLDRVVVGATATRIQQAAKQTQWKLKLSAATRRLGHEWQKDFREGIGAFAVHHPGRKTQDHQIQPC